MRARPGQSRMSAASPVDRRRRASSHVMSGLGFDRLVGVFGDRVEVGGELVEPAGAGMVLDE